MSNLSNRISALVLIIGLLPLGACATMERGSSTAFVVQTIPEGASVTTDLIRPASQAKQTNGTGEDAQYYGCSPTPCSFELPRRSDFNVLITHSGQQPFTWAVTKEHNKVAVEDSNRNNAAIGATTGAATAAYGWINAATLGTTAGPAIAGTAAVIGIMAVPTAGAAGMVDMASGALIDLHPNPLKVKMAPELSPEESQKLIDAFRRSREVHTAEGK